MMRIMSRMLLVVAALTELPDFGGRLWRMAYEKNGAELVWLDCTDENRTFVVFFKTIPSDDSGVAHIIARANLQVKGA